MGTCHEDSRLASRPGRLTDQQRDILHNLAAEYGLTVASQVAIDDTWSALRFKRADG